MSLQAAVDAWTAWYIKSREANRSRLIGVSSFPDERRHHLIAGPTATIAAAKRPNCFRTRAQGEEVTA
jgi:hypothetical protein